MPIALPFHATNIAELVPTAAGDMITTLIFFHDYFAFFALLPFIIIHQKRNLIRCTRPLMDGKKAHSTKLLLTTFTLDFFTYTFDVQNTFFTIFIWAESEMRLADCQHVKVDFFVPFLHVRWELFEKC